MEKGIYPAVLQNWYPDFFDVDNFVQPFMSCDQGSPETLCESGATFSDGTFYYSERANELIQQQRAELDPEVRNGMLEELQQLMIQDVPSIPLWQNKDYVFAQSGVEGVEIQPTQQFLFWQIAK
jgi:peptide/nickel transport system substrate-binding protein